MANVQSRRELPSALDSKPLLRIKLAVAFGIIQQQYFVLYFDTSHCIVYTLQVQGAQLLML